MKTGGVLLAGGRGTRLYPNTKYLNKHLMPMYDKPMIYYSLSIFLLSGIKNVVLVCNTGETQIFKKLLGDGSELGMNILYSEQESPDGIPDAISKALEVQNFDKFLVVLGDNFIFGEKFFTRFEEIFDKSNYSSIFSQNVNNPENFGVVEVQDDKVFSLTEKPIEFISNKAVIGVYIFDDTFNNHFENITKSKRGEYEILDIVKSYGLENINHNSIGRGTAWFDMGSSDDFLNCSQFVRTIQKRQGLLVCSPHEIAYRNGWIDEKNLLNYIKTIENSEYSENLLKVLESE